MPVVINEFEVVPEQRSAENQTADKKSDEKGSQKSEMSDYEVKKILERRMERLERVSAN